MSHERNVGDNRNILIDNKSFVNIQCSYIWKRH